MKQLSNEIQDQPDSVAKSSTRGLVRYLLLHFKSLLLLIVIFGVQFVGAGTQSAQAEEPYLAFLQGLRERQYFDSAMLYLQDLEGRKNVPPEIKQIIAYEKAITLLQGSKYLQNPEIQAEQLGQAQAYLEQFIKEAPNHKLVATANTEMARILLGKAQVLVWKSRSPSNEENRSKFQIDARKLIAQAKGIFQKAHDSYKSQWDSFGVFIPEDEKEKRAARKRVEGLYMRAQIDLATCAYEDAQTYDRGSKEFKSRLRKCSLVFEKIHTKYRSQYAGLYARTMQGKCFEEQDSIREALGIYGELLDHPGTSAGLKKLQHQVLHFRLICLNHESKKDYQLIELEASDWLKFNKSINRSQIGLGIRWELAQALEKLATDRTTPEANRLRFLRSALDHARQINKYAGPYKDVSHSMIQKLLVSLDREPGDPKDFDTAFGTSNSLLEQVAPLLVQLEKAKAAGDKKKIQTAEQDLQAQLSETERLYRLALELADDYADEGQVNAARYKLAYTFYMQRKSLDAAVVGKYLAIRKKDSDPTIALDAAYLSWASFSQAYNDAPEQYKEKKLALIVDISKFIAINWPDSDRAVDARLAVGRIFRRSDKPLEAAKWYAEIPATAKQYPVSQLEAGQSFWVAYLTNAFKESSDISDKQLTEWQTKAAKHLETGITKRQQIAPEKEASPAELIRGKVSLAQIEIMRGNDAKAIEWLTAEPHSVTKAVQVADGKTRPKEDFNIKSTAFASLAYQYLLRAYIGTRQLDKAELARAELEKIAGASGGQSLTAVYIELGRELQKELERLQKAGDTARLEKVRGGFEQFLGKLFERKSGQTYGSLIWIAETYFGMAQGSQNEPQKSKQYYTDATTTFEEILKRGENDSGFMDPSRLDGVRLRLVNCKRQEKDFAKAESLIKSVLKKNGKALDAQIEAALVYQSWGEQGNEPERFLDAARGKEFKDGVTIWGWGNISRRLQMQLNSGQLKPVHKEKHRQAQYHLIQSLYQYAKASSDLDVTEKNLRRAKLELLTFANLTPSLQKTDWWDKYDTLYQDIQTLLGEAPVALTKVEATTQSPENSATTSNYDDGSSLVVEDPDQPASANKTAKKPASSIIPYVFMGVVLLVGIGFIGMMMKSSPRKGGKRSTSEMIAAIPSETDEISFNFEQPAPEKAPRKKTRPKPTAETPAEPVKKTRPPASPEQKKRKQSQQQKPGSKSKPQTKPQPKQKPQSNPKSQQKPAEGTPKKRVRKKPPKPKEE